MPQPGPREEIDALAAEGAKLSMFLRGIAPEDWKRPTRCTEFDLRDLVVHLTTMIQVLGDGCDEQFPGAAPENDRLGWWDYDIEEDQKGTADWIAEARSHFPDGPILAEWEAGLERAVGSVVRCMENGDPLVRPHEKLIRLSDYVATRVLEVTIHTMDVRDAFGLGPDPTPEGMAVTHGILAGLLGADPRASGFDDADFANASTGRRSLSAEEKGRLGPLAARLPVLG